MPVRKQPSSMQALQSRVLGFDPTNPAGGNLSLLAQSDARTNAARAQEDASVDLTDPTLSQQRYFTQWNRAQQDSAVGPGGYNRQWVPLLEAMQGKKINTASLDLPIDSDPSGFTGSTQALQRYYRGY